MIYNPYDDEGQHALEQLREYTFEDPTLSYKLVQYREGVSVEVTGSNPVEMALMTEYLYLLTQHIPGYAQDPDTGRFKTKIYDEDAVEQRPRKTRPPLTKKDYGRIAAIKKAREAKKG